MRRIGVISDTHGTLPWEVHAAFKECDHIIHAGDIGTSAVLYELETCAPVTAVLGNCDFEDYGYGLQAAAVISIEGVRILVLHRPKDLRAALAGSWPQVLGPGDPLPQIGIHGHTHTPRKELTGAVLTLCPGSPVIPRNSSASVALLTLNGGKILDAKIVALEGH